MASEAQGQRATNGFREGQTPKAAKAVRLTQSTPAAEAVEVNGTARTSPANIDFLKDLQDVRFRQAPIVTFAADLIFDRKPLLDMPRVQIRRDGPPSAPLHGEHSCNRRSTTAFQRKAPLVTSSIPQFPHLEERPLFISIHAALHVDQYAIELAIVITVPW